MLLLSIRPRFVDAILAGEKTVELRRRSPRKNCDYAMIYASAPQMELVASFRIARLLKGPLPLLWLSVQERAAVSRREFYQYFSGRAEGVAIEIADIQKVPPIPLSTLRGIWKGFHPPQGFRYLTQDDMDKLRKSLRIAA